MSEFAGAPHAEVARLAACDADRSLGQELALGCTFAHALLMQGAHDEAVAFLTDLLERSGEDESSWRAFADALMGLAMVLDGRPAEGFDRLRQVVGDTGSVEANWLYPRIRLVEGLAQLLAGDVAGARRTALDALVECRDWGITWGLPWAVELAAFVLDETNETQRAAIALGAVDGAYSETGGQSVSAHPGTILHARRRALLDRTASGQLEVGQRIGLTAMANRLIEHLRMVSPVGTSTG